MDENLVEQISTATGVPQELVSRSAQARAQASGVDVNAILASWSTGEAPAVSSTPVENVVEEAFSNTIKQVKDMTNEKMKNLSDMGVPKDFNLPM